MKLILWLVEGYTPPVRKVALSKIFYCMCMTVQMPIVMLIGVIENMTGYTSGILYHLIDIVFAISKCSHVQQVGSACGGCRSEVGLRV